MNAIPDSAARDAVRAYLAVRVGSLYAPELKRQDDCDSPIVAESYVAVADAMLLSLVPDREQIVAEIQLRIVARQAWSAERDHGSVIHVDPYTDTVKVAVRRTDSDVRVCGYALSGEEMGLFEMDPRSGVQWQPKSADSVLVNSLLRRERLR